MGRLDGRSGVKGGSKDMKAWQTHNDLGFLVFGLSILVYHYRFELGVFRGDGRGYILGFGFPKNGGVDGGNRRWVLQDFRCIGKG